MSLGVKLLERALFSTRFENMPPISQQQPQTSTLKPQKSGCFYVKFSPEFNELGLFFVKQPEVAKKWLKLK